MRWHIGAELLEILLFFAAFRLFANSNGHCAEQLFSPCFRYQWSSIRHSIGLPIILYCAACIGTPHHTYIAILNRATESHSHICSIVCAKCPLQPGCATHFADIEKPVAAMRRSRHTHHYAGRLGRMDNMPLEHIARNQRDNRTLSARQKISNLLFL